jgi:hypothetical protein
MFFGGSLVEVRDGATDGMEIGSAFSFTLDVG